MDLRKIKKLIDLLEESNLAEIEIKEGEESVRLARTPRGTRARRTDSSPSLISISARLDSSSRSMSFLILRRSMLVSLLDWIRLECRRAPAGQAAAGASRANAASSA